MQSVSMKVPTRVFRHFLAPLACVASLVAWPASALVGPARDAPELAPYVVMVVDRQDMSFCTASVIDPKIVLTAAHCVTSPESTAVLFLDRDGERVFVETTEVEVHPGYRPDSERRGRLSIDLALVRLLEPLPSQFRPVALSQSPRVDVGERFLIAGFGIADEHEAGTGGTLREGTVEVSNSTPPFLIRLRDPRDQGLGGCTGDSGAPIFQSGRPVVVAVAILAKGENGQRCGAATEAVLVAPQRHWIDAILQSWARETSAR